MRKAIVTVACLMAIFSCHLLMIMAKEAAGGSPNGGKALADGSQQEVAGLSPGTVRENPSDTLKYVWVPPGTFMMGCSGGDDDCMGEEKPTHPVTISRGFWLGQTPVTAAAYKKYAATTGTEMPAAPDFNPDWNDPTMPIVNITWDDASAYCAWAGGRLPTEAEWEYAARGGSTAAQYGNLDEIAWYAANSGHRTHEVGQKRPNALGLDDMLGNVWQWVQDWYDADYYSSSPSQDPTGPDQAVVVKGPTPPASGEARVLRGGSWSNAAMFVRVSSRFWGEPSLSYFDVGFRCSGEMFAP